MRRSIYLPQPVRLRSRARARDRHLLDRLRQHRVECRPLVARRHRRRADRSDDMLGLGEKPAQGEPRFSEPVDLVVERLRCVLLLRRHRSVERRWRVARRRRRHASRSHHALGLDAHGLDAKLVPGELVFSPPVSRKLLERCELRRDPLQLGAARCCTKLSPGFGRFRNDRTLTRTRARLSVGGTRLRGKGRRAPDNVNRASGGGRLLAAERFAKCHREAQLVVFDGGRQSSAGAGRGQVAAALELRAGREWRKVPVCVCVERRRLRRRLALVVDGPDHWNRVLLLVVVTGVPHGMFGK